jgi:hypothetical protein
MSLQGRLIEVIPAMLQKLVSAEIYQNMYFFAHSPERTLIITVKVPSACLYGAGRKDFDAGNIHYEGHWKG